MRAIPSGQGKKSSLVIAAWSLKRPCQHEGQPVPNRGPKKEPRPRDPDESGGQGRGSHQFNKCVQIPRPSLFARTTSMRGLQSRSIGTKASSPQAGLLAQDDSQVASSHPSTSPGQAPNDRRTVTISTDPQTKNVHHSGASASDSHRLPFAKDCNEQSKAGIRATCRRNEP